MRAGCGVGSFDNLGSPDDFVGLCGILDLSMVRCRMQDGKEAKYPDVVSIYGGYLSDVVPADETWYGDYSHDGSRVEIHRSMHLFGCVFAWRKIKPGTNLCCK